jgi:predicted RND superfamily exporter protein
VASFNEWFVLFIMLPALSRHIPQLGIWVKEKRAGETRWLSRLAERGVSRPSLALGMVAFVLSIIGFNFVRIHEYPTKNFPAYHVISESYKYIAESRGWENALAIVFKYPNIHDERERVENVLQELAKFPQVRGVESPFALEDFVSKKLPEQLAALPRTEIKATAAYRRLFSARDQARATVYIKSAELGALREVVEYIRNLCPNQFCEPVGQSIVYLEFSEKVIPTLLASFAWSAALVALILLSLARALKLKNYFSIAYSALWGPVVMIGVISLFQIPVSLITSMFAATIIGLTGDNAIQYMFAAADGKLLEGVKSRGETSVILSLLLAFSSLVFLLESLKPVQVLGVLFFLGFILNLIGDLWTLKGLLVTDRKRNASKK